MVLGAYTTEFDFGTSYKYPFLTPTSLSAWYSSTGIGTPDSNPGGWTVDGTDAGWFDNGTMFEEDYPIFHGVTGQYLIARYLTGGFNSEWSIPTLIP